MIIRSVTFLPDVVLTCLLTLLDVPGDGGQAWSWCLLDTTISRDLPIIPQPSLREVRLAVVEGDLRGARVLSDDRNHSAFTARELPVVPAVHRLEARDWCRDPAVLPRARPGHHS